jgi:hypothetical protein
MLIRGRRRPESGTYTVHVTILGRTFKVYEAPLKG